MRVSRRIALTWDKASLEDDAGILVKERRQYAPSLLLMCYEMIRCRVLP
jgi:hypothetical protein